MTHCIYCPLQIIIFLVKKIASNILRKALALSNSYKKTQLQKYLN